MMLNFIKKMMVFYKYLNDISKKLGNVTAKAFIDNYILLETKRNLSKKNYSRNSL